MHGWISLEQPRLKKGNEPVEPTYSLAVLEKELFRAMAAQKEYKPAESICSLAVLGRKL